MVVEIRVGDDPSYVVVDHHIVHTYQVEHGDDRAPVKRLNTNHNISVRTKNIQKQMEQFKPFFLFLAYLNHTVSIEKQIKYEYLP